MIALVPVFRNSFVTCRRTGGSLSDVQYRNCLLYSGSKANGTKFMSLDQAAFAQLEGDLDGVGGGAFADVVGDDPEVQAVVDT